MRNCLSVPRGENPGLHNQYWQRCIVSTRGRAGGEEGHEKQQGGEEKEKVYNINRRKMRGRTTLAPKKEQNKGLFILPIGGEMNKPP